jgi:hypothetical protein
MEGKMATIMKRLAPWVSLAGIFTLLVGVGWDAILHRRDDALAAREGIFTLTNPGHLLFAIGIALCVTGGLAFLAGRVFEGKFSLVRFVTLGGAASLLVVCALVSFALAVSSESVLAREHTRAANEIEQPSNPDQSAPDLGQFPHQHLESGPHVQLTSARQPVPGDIARADAINQAARQALSKYKDVRMAEQDGYKMFAPGVPVQEEYHFTKTANSILAAFTFEPTKPTSLLYRKTSDGNFVLVGFMYHAPAKSTQKQLDLRYPTSVAPWHLHTNICLAPKGQTASAYLGPTAKFGPRARSQIHRLRIRRWHISPNTVRLDGAHLSI